MKKLLVKILLLTMLLFPAQAMAARKGTLTTNSSTSITLLAGYDKTFHMNTLYLAGTFGGGTVTLEASPDGGTTWVVVDGSAWTSAVVANIEFRWTALRLTLTGATSPSITWWMVGE